MIRWVAPLVVLALATGIARAEASDAAAEAAFHAAEARASHGDEGGAIDAFVAVADGAPTSRWADDALAEAARNAEDLGELARAAALWRRIVEQYPDGREARRAQVRLADLIAEIGPHGEWADVAAAHDRIVRDTAGHALDPLMGAVRLDALIAQHPGYPRAAVGRLWIGDTYLRAGELARARTAYEQAGAASTTPLDRWRAKKALADVAAADGDLDDAEDAYRALRGGAGIAEDGALDIALHEVAVKRGRLRREQVAITLLVLVVIAAFVSLRRDTGSWRAVARALAQPPTEAIYAAPIAFLLTMLAWHNDPVVGRAVAWVALGGAVGISWLSGVTLAAVRARRGRLSAARAFGQAFVAAASAIAVCYIALVHFGLMDMIVETWQHGHDPR